MADEDLHYCCIVEPRCRLCQFPLQDGESVLVARGGRPSPSFPFRRGDTCIRDDGARIAYHMCCRKSCSSRTSVASCFHEDCYSFKPSPLSPNFIPATHHDFTPPASGDVRRRRRIQRTLARKLGLDIMSGVPEDLCYMVAEHLVRECAIVTCQQLTSRSLGGDCDVDLSVPVYATYVKFEGIPYLQFLSNRPCSPDGKGAGLVFEAAEGEVVGKVYVAYDHLGVRGVQFVTSEGEPPPLPPITRGVWWRELAGEHGVLRIAAETDGLKLRRILDATDPRLTTSTRAGHGWATPGLDCQLIDLETCRIAKGEPGGLRINFLDWNRPGTDGYSAAIQGFHLSKLVAHRPGGDVGFYKERDSVSDQPVLWMYLPIDPGETITEIWAVKLWSHSVALLLRTNHERAVLFGSYFLENGPGFKLHQLCTTADVASRLYYNEWDPVHGNTWIDYLGVDLSTAKPGFSVGGLVKDLRTRYPPRLSPARPPPYRQYNELWNYTNCRLEDVEEVTPCVDPGPRHRAVVGMLVRYRNGCRACLGQYRLDWAAATFAVDPSRALFFGLGKSSEQRPYVARVGQQGAAASDPEGLQWVEAPLQGRLEWWFSHRQSRLVYSDKGVSELLGGILAGERSDF